MDAATLTLPEFFDARSQLGFVANWNKPKTAAQITSEMAAEQIEEEKALKRRKVSLDE